jgi:beta-lactamase regulating signal transducer with metallopeptidase domain
MSSDTMMNWAGHTGLDISILIVLVLMCRRPFVKMFGARAAYALWALPILRLLLPELPITLPRPSWMQATASAPVEIITASGLDTTVIDPVTATINWQYPIIAIWLIVAVVWLVAQLMRQHKYIGSLRADASPISEKVQNKFGKACCSLKLNTMPKIYMSASNTGPMVAGVLSPIIILPKNFERDYDDRQQVFALSHELAHIKRGDLWAALGALIFRAINWPNPLVHYCAIKFRTDQEAACDAYVLNMIGGGTGTKQSYAATLIHSARLTRNSTRTSTNRSVLANPLCLTIYHPLKERLMTLKTSKINSTILSRLGVGAFLIAALVGTAPITFASDGPKAEAPKVKTETKKVMKWVQKNDGEETTKHIEVTVKDGVTTAYSIDKDGNKTEIDASEIEMMDGIEGMEGMNVFVMDGMSGEKHIKIMKGKHMGGMDGKHMKRMKIMNGEDGHSKIIIKRMSKGEDGAEIDIDSEVMFFSGEGKRAAAMVGAAQGLLEQVETMNGGKELSSKARKKLAKARKALKEAQEALEAEE